VIITAIYPMTRVPSTYHTGSDLEKEGGHSPLFIRVTKITLYTNIYCTDCLKNGSRVLRSLKRAQKYFPNVLLFGVILWFQKKISVPSNPNSTLSTPRTTM